jgi:asparaginase
MRGLTLEEACERALDHVAALGGEAGLIAVDAAGGVALPFNTGAMYRGLSRVGAAPVTATLPGELLGGGSRSRAGRRKDSPRGLEPLAQQTTRAQRGVVHLGVISAHNGTTPSLPARPRA